jgi:hypothetical protein
MDYNRVQYRTHARKQRRKLWRRDRTDVHQSLREIYGGNHSVTNPYTDRHSGLNGLGADPSGGSDTPVIEGGVQTVANFIPIPGVGQAVGAIMAIMNKVFGWGDPTPEHELLMDVISLRERIAQQNIAAGVPDDFHIPTGLDVSNPDELDSFALVIVNDVLKKIPSLTLAGDTSLQIQHDDYSPKLWPAYVHEERADLYKVLNLLKGQVTGTEGLDITHYNAVQSAASGQTEPSSGDPSQTQASSSASFLSSINWQADMPYILAGAGFLLLLTMAGKSGSTSNE